MSDTKGDAAKTEENPSLSAAAVVFGTALIDALSRLARLTSRYFLAGSRRILTLVAQAARAILRFGHDLGGWVREHASADRQQPAAVTSELDQPVQRRRRRRLIKTATIAFLLLLGLGSVLTAVVVIWAVRDMPLADILPAIEEPHIAITTPEGDTLYSQGAYRAGYASMTDLPKSLPEAVVAVEDKRFYAHGGIDFRAIARAAVQNLRNGGIAQGGSTITQQLVKVLYLDPERTFQRKLQEMVLAIALDRQLGKDRILELYLNSIYLGSGAWGVPAAAEIYFDRQVSQLTLAQAAILAASIRSPSQINLRTDPEAARNRAALVLRLMEEQNRITSKDRRAAEVELASLVAMPSSEHAGSFYIDWVLEQTDAISNATEGRFSVTATLDPNLQAEAERIIVEIMSGPGRAAGASQAALVAMTAEGHVRAMVGGVDYTESQFNRATDALRQPGSTFKLPVYLAALAMGATPDSVISDDPIEIDGWSPENYGGVNNGAVTLSQAFARSLNSASVRLAHDIGIDNVIKVARQLGIEGPLADGPSLALGTSEVTLLDMTEAYAAILAGRMPVNATGIAALTFVEGETVRMMPAAAPDSVTMTHTREPMLRLLRDVVIKGTGKGAKLSGFAAGKTGTSQDNRDAWFIGFSDTLVVGVWVGNDDGTPMDGVTGGGIPVDIWRSVMEVAQMSDIKSSAAQSVSPSPASTTAAPAQCNIRACSRFYRSFRASDCTFQPYRGSRQLCIR